MMMEISILLMGLKQAHLDSADMPRHALTGAVPAFACLNSRQTLQHVDPLYMSHVKFSGLLLVSADCFGSSALIHRWFRGASAAA